MNEKRKDKIWSAFRDKAIKVSDRDHFESVSGRHSLKELFNNWVPPYLDFVHDEDVDTEDAAEGFLELTQHYFEGSSQTVIKDRDSAVAYPLRYGSLQSIFAYAEALPIVLKARQEVLGRVEPLSSEEADQWLERETTESARTVVEITYKFSIPETASWLNEKVVQAIRRGEEVGFSLRSCGKPLRACAGHQRTLLLP